MPRPTSKRRSTASSPLSAPWRWAWAGALVGLLLTAVIQAPARWLTTLLQQTSQGRVVFDDAQGTVWSGSARLTLAGGAGSQDAATLPGRLTWHLRPTASALRVDLQADCCMPQAWRLSLRPHWGGAQLTLADSQSQWPAKLLTGLGTPWNTVQIEGQMNFSSQGLELDWNAGRLGVTGQARLDALQLSSRLSTLKPMGSYRVTVTGGTAPSLQLETLKGSLQLSGTGQWVGAKLRFDGEASAAPERLDALSNLLNIIGRRDGARAIIKVG